MTLQQANDFSDKLTYNSPAQNYDRVISLQIYSFKEFRNDVKKALQKPSYVLLAHGSEVWTCSV